MPSHSSVERMELESKSARRMARGVSFEGKVAPWGIEMSSCDNGNYMAWPRNRIVIPWNQARMWSELFFFHEVLNVVQRLSYRDSQILLLQSDRIHSNLWIYIEICLLKNWLPHIRSNSFKAHSFIFMFDLFSRISRLLINSFIYFSLLLIISISNS